MKWIEDIFPDNQEWKKFSRNLISVRDSVRDTIVLGMICLRPVTKELCVM